MNSKSPTIGELFRPTGIDPAHLDDPAAAQLVIHKNEVLGLRMVPGLEVSTRGKEQGVDVEIIVLPGEIIARPVHICFGVLPEQGVQKIGLKVTVKKDGRVSLYAHCVFPNAVDVQHDMQAEIILEEDAEYSYLERHVHSPSGGVRVFPRARITVGPRSRFRTEFELLKGRVGEISIDYEADCMEEGVMEMTSRVHGSGDDIIRIRESCNLLGARSRGVLTSRIAVQDRAQAEVYNRLIASAPFARGHVDCKEIVQGEGRARAIPVVEVRDPRAHITHEAAIGSVDNKQLETLMSRGLTEDEAVDLIIEGLLA